MSKINLDDPRQIAALQALGWSGCLHDSDCACSDARTDRDAAILARYRPPRGPAPAVEPEVRLRMSLSEAEAVRRLLRGERNEPGDDAALNRVEMHVGSVVGIVRANLT